jgi:hypothetical protein
VNVCQPGDPIKLPGPSSKVLLMPEDKKDNTYIMVAKGTGIAPFRGFMRRLFGKAISRIRISRAWRGSSWVLPALTPSSTTKSSRSTSRSTRGQEQGGRQAVHPGQDGILEKHGGGVREVSLEGLEECSADCAVDRTVVA